jgi:ketosteroid isomerase-like protein
MVHPNEEHLREGYDAFPRGDLAPMRSKFADDVTLHVPGGGPLGGEFKGVDDVMAWVGTSAELSGGTVHVDVHDILANDDHGIVLARRRQSGRASALRTTMSSSSTSGTGRSSRSRSIPATCTPQRSSGRHDLGRSSAMASPVRLRRAMPVTWLAFSPSGTSSSVLPSGSTASFRSAHLQRRAATFCPGTTMAMRTRFNRLPRPKGKATLLLYHSNGAERVAKEHRLS